MNYPSIISVLFAAVLLFSCVKCEKAAEEKQPTYHFKDVTLEKLPSAYDQKQGPAYTLIENKEPAKNETGKAEVVAIKMEEPKNENKTKKDADVEAKLKEYKEDPYHYYDHQYLSDYHPKYWVRIR